MKLTVSATRIDRQPTALSVIGVFEDGGTLADRLPVAAPAKRMLLPLLASVQFRAKLKETVVLPSQGKLRARWVAVVGLGKRKEFILESARKLGGIALSVARGRKVAQLAVQLPAHGTWTAEQLGQAVTEGLLLGQYRYLCRQLKPDEKFQVSAAVIVADPKALAAVQRGARVGAVIATSANVVRDLCNAPANIATPTYLADHAHAVAKEHKLTFHAYSAADLKRMKMGGIISVTQGSVQPPKFVVMEYRSSQQPAASSQQDKRPNAERRTPNATARIPTVVFVGKGITFDSGGISIKPSGGMEKMKYDMSGAAAVIGILKASAALKLPFRIIGIFAACENMPSGSATRPGDIVTMHSGKTVEVLNTDAEGRMILADCLAYAKQFKPDAVVDMATLTGACVVALGKYAIGLMGTDETLKSRLKAAGELSGERVWELPLWPEYSDDVKGDAADLKNIGPPGEAGAITAAAFLKTFTAYPWAHLDIAGTAWADAPDTFQPKGSTGVGVRLAIQMLRAWAAEMTQNTKR